MDDLSFINQIRDKKIPIITVNTTSRIIKKEKRYASLFLYRLKKRGIIREIEKGKYALSDTHIHVIASNLTTPSYISLLSAYSIHGLTTQIPVEVQVLTTHNKKNIRYENTTIRFIKIKPYMIYGVQKTGGIVLAEKEKAVADSLKMPKYCAISETYSALAEGEMNPGKLIEYTRRTRSQVALKRLGYLLEKTGIDTREKIGKVSEKYQPLNPLLPEKGRKNRKWRLIENEEL